jgi:uncharacterized glyoxalase superfamily protein PhnB
VTVGNNVSICIECEDQAEQDRFFTTLSQGCEVTMGLQDTFGARLARIGSGAGAQTQ